MPDARELVLLSRLLCWGGRYEEAKWLLQQVGRGLLESARSDRVAGNGEPLILAVADERLEGGVLGDREAVIRWDWSLEAQGSTWSRARMMLRAMNPSDEKLTIGERVVSYRASGDTWGPGEAKYGSVELRAGESRAIYRELVIDRSRQEKLLRATVSVEGSETGYSRWLSVLRIPGADVAALPVAATVRWYPL